MNHLRLAPTTAKATLRDLRLERLQRGCRGDEVIGLLATEATYGSGG